MKDVVIIEAFTGYPDGVKEVTFTPSPEPISVRDDFADLIVDVKKHARWPKAADAKPAKDAAK